MTFLVKFHRRISRWWPTIPPLVYLCVCDRCKVVFSFFLEHSSVIIKFTFQNFPVNLCKSRQENPQKLTQLSSRSNPRHLVGKRTAQKDTIIDITSDSQVNSNFPYRWSPAILTCNNYFYLYCKLSREKVLYVSDPIYNKGFGFMGYSWVFRSEL